MSPALPESRDASAPLLAIGAVVAELRGDFPDVSHSSLRFLEREGLIQATRTPGGHRLYSLADVERIRQIKTWQAQRLSLEEIRRRLAELDRLPAPPALMANFLRQAVAGDLAAAYQTIITAANVGMPVVKIFGEVLRPALVEIGERWERGEILVAQEKEISELMREIIAELAVRITPTAPHGAALVAACVEGERHELGLRMLCALCRGEGWSVHYLGADVAPRFVREAVQLHRPAAVLLSARLASNLPAVREAIATLTAGLAPADLPPIIVGGRVAIEHSADIQAWGAHPVDDIDPQAAMSAIAAILRPAGAAPAPATADAPQPAARAK